MPSSSAEHDHHAMPSQDLHGLQERLSRLETDIEAFSVALGRLSEVRIGAARRLSSGDLGVRRLELGTVSSASSLGGSGWPLAMVVGVGVTAAVALCLARRRKVGCACCLQASW